MELLTLKKIELKNTIRKALDPFEFDLEMHCKEDIEDKVIFTILYTVNVSNESEDQILSETEIFPIPKGNLKFTLEADAPDIKAIPYEQLFGLTSIIIVGKYKEEQFIRVGYIVDVYYPGIPNDKLLYNEDEAEDIDEGLEGEDIDEGLEEEEDENFDDLVVNDEENPEDEGSEDEENEESLEAEEFPEDEENDQALENEEHPKSFNDAMAENAGGNFETEKDEVQPAEYKKIISEMDKPVFEDGESFDFRGYKINFNNIELNVMVPPSVHSFLIKWKDSEEEICTEEVLESEEEDDNVKKIKKE